MHKHIFVWILIGLTVFALLDLTHPGLPVTHDGQDHVARIANFAASISEGNIVPRWAGNLNWGFGHPVLMFLYPLPSYMTSVIYAIGIPLVVSVKLVFAATFIIGVLGMYGWISRVYGKYAGFVSAVLYGFLPYRFVDLYVRGALGEHVAFAWIPFLFLGLYSLTENKYKTSGLLLTISTAFLILSHNAVSLMIFPVAFLYFAYLTVFKVKHRYQYVEGVLVAVILGFSISAFFWIPALVEGKYTLRDIVTAKEYASRFVPLKDFVFSRWNYGGTDTLPKSIGLSGLLSMILTFVIYRRYKKQEHKVFAGGLLAVFLFTLFLMTDFSIFIWDNLTVLQKFQFPWRFLTVSVFISAVTAGFVSGILKQTKRISIGLSVITIVLSLPMWHAKNYSVKPETFYTGVYDSTTDTGESSPIWSVRSMDHSFTDPLEIVEGVSVVTPVSRTTTEHVYTVMSTSPTRLVENTLYFPGWQVYVDGNKTDIEFQDPQYRGLMTFWVGAGDHDVRVVFTQTKLRVFAGIISFVGLLSVLGIYTLMPKP